MFPEELKFTEFGPAPEPSPELWPRIAQAYRARVVRRRRVRIASVTAFACAALAVFVALPRNPAATDWQARAQALEIELRAVPSRDVALADPVALEAQSQLAQLDGVLQAAYDRGAKKNELVALWKQRSELLSTLLAVRQQTVAVTRI